MRPQRLEPGFNVGIDVMMPTFGPEPKYRVTVLTGEKWTRGPRTSSVFKGFVWFTDGSGRTEGIGAGVGGQYVGRSLSISVGEHVTIFKAEVYAILACVCEIQTNVRPETYTYVSICTDSQAALRALQAAKTLSPLVRQCQNALNDISTRYTVGLCWVPGHAGVRRNEIAPTSLQEAVLFRSL
jgi:ribonuclease HI